MELAKPTRALPERRQRHLGDLPCNRLKTTLVSWGAALVSATGLQEGQQFCALASDQALDAALEGRDSGGL